VSAIRQVIAQLSTVRVALDRARTRSLSAVQAASDAVERATALGAGRLTEDLMRVVGSCRQLSEMVNQAAATAVDLVVMAEAVGEGTSAGQKAADQRRPVADPPPQPSAGVPPAPRFDPAKAQELRRFADQPKTVGRLYDYDTDANGQIGR
jgi:hypothetical protein